MLCSFHLHKIINIVCFSEGRCIRVMTVINEWVAGTRMGGWVQRCRESRRLVLFIVAIALLLDNMLLTTVGKNCYL